MKTITTLLVTCFLCMHQVNADSLRLPEGFSKTTVSYKSICISGYVFAIAYSRYGIELKQIYRDGGGALASPQPKKCEASKVK